MALQERTRNQPGLHTPLTDRSTGPRWAIHLSTTQIFTCPPAKNIEILTCDTNWQSPKAAIHTWQRTDLGYLGWALDCF
jgi:hypothetical protein